MPTKKITCFVCVIMVVAMVLSSIGVGFLSAPTSADVETLLFEGPIYNPVTDAEQIIEETTPEIEKPDLQTASTSGTGNTITSNDGSYYQPNAAPWGDWSYRDAHNVPEVEAMGYTGNDVTVALVDTGIDFVSENLAGKYMVYNQNTSSPYYGWPVAFDAVGLPNYLLSKEAEYGSTGGIANTTQNGTGPFDIDHEITVDGKPDYLRNEKVGSDTTGDIKTPGTATGLEFDLAELWTTRDDTFWYTGIKTFQAGINRTFGFSYDFDGSASGGTYDPIGNYLNFDASHSAPIEQVSYDSNNGLIASCAAKGAEPAITNGYEQNSIKIWDEDGILVKTLPDEVHPVTSVIWSPDGSKLAYQTLTDVVVYDTATWTVLIREEHSTSVAPANRETLAFSPNGTMLLAGSLLAGNELFVLNVDTGDVAKPAVDARPLSIAYSPDESQIALGLSNGHIQIINAANYSEEANYVAPGLVDTDDRQIETLAWSPNGTQIATGRESTGMIDIWDLTVNDNRFQWGGEGTKINGPSLTGLPLVDRFYMRAIPNEVSANGLTTYQLGTGGTDGGIQLAPVMDAGVNHTWGMQVFLRNSAGVEGELTNGISAIVQRTTNGYGSQAAFWTPPAIDMNLTDSIVMKIYQGRNTDTPTTQVAEFSTAQLGATHLNSTLWTISYFTRRSNESGAIIGRMFGHDSTVNALNWTATGLTSAGNDGKIITWNPATYTAVTSRDSLANSPVLSFSIDGSSGNVYVGTQDCAVRRYPAAWDSSIPFIAHKPDVMVYVRYEREYYTYETGGQKLDVFDKIYDPLVYRWNVTQNAWDETNMTRIFGESFYKGNLAGEWTEHGFLEIALPRNFTAWPDQNDMYMNSFTCNGQLIDPDEPSTPSSPNIVQSRPQDTCPSDCNVPSDSSNWVDWTGTRETILSSWAMVSIPEVTITDSEITSVRPVDNRTYHFGYHPSESMSNLFGSLVPMLVVESTTEGVWDKIYVDMNQDYVFDAKDEWVDKNNPVLQLDFWDKDGNASVPGESTDGIPDVSGGLLYFIGDGETKMPYSDRMESHLLDALLLRIAFNVDNPMPIPGNGEIVAFYGDMDYNYNSDEPYTHGTQMASAIAGEGLNPGDNDNPIKGVSPNITFLPIMNAHVNPSYALQFAVEGYDGIPNTGDEAQIVSVGQYSTGYGSGLDETSHLVEYLVNTTDSKTVFVSPAGNDGSGYGTVAAPCGMNTLVVGFAEDNSFIASGGNVHHQGMVSEMSSRGPTAAGIAKPDVIALGLGDVDLPLGSSGSFQTSVGSKNQYINWKSSDLAAAVTTGVMALVFEAYKDAHGSFPSTQVAMDIIRSSAKDLGYDPLTQGAGFVDALAAVKLAKGTDGLIVSADKTSFGNTFGNNYDSFINVLAPGDNDSLPVTIKNPTSGSQNALYDFEYMNRIALDEYYQLVPSTISATNAYKEDITDKIPMDAEMIKVTAQTNASWWTSGGDYKTFVGLEGYFQLKLMDWVDAQPIGSPNHGVIDPTDDLNYLTSVEFKDVNALMCTLSNPHEQLAGRLVVQLFLAGDSVITDRVWKFSIESFASTSMDWITTSKTGENIASGATDTVNLNVDVPANAESGTYAGSFVTTYGPTTDTYDTSIPYSATPDTGYLNTILESTYWDYGNLGNYWSDYTIEYPAATNDGTVWDTSYELQTPGKRDNFPLVDPVTTYSDAMISTSPFSISWNGEFEDYATEGDGSAGNPWLIENLDIDGTSFSQPGILISNTDDYFIIRNCVIHDAQGTQSGIYLDNVDNGRIMDSEFYDNTGNGVQVAYASNILIDDNYFHHNLVYGLTVDNSEYVYVYDNEITENTGPWTGMGIFMTYSSYCEIISNEIYNNDYALGSAGLGIESDCWYNVVAGNYFHDESWTGIETYEAHYTNIHNNTFDGATESVSLYGSVNPIRVVDNDFLNMGGAFAFDENPGVNNWDGNYWGDYTDVDTTPADGIWDNPYLIIDSDWSAPPAESADNMALVNPVAAPTSYYEDRGIITINGDADFTGANGVVGGIGTAADPYIITGWAIDNTGETHAISVSNTDAYFVIMNCMISGTGTEGIMLDGANNGTVHTVKMTSNMGIKVQASTNFFVAYNDIQVAATRIHIIGSDNGTVFFNDITGGDNGIHIESSQDCNVELNSVDTPTLAGIWIDDSARIDVTENRISNSLGDGILLEQSTDCLFTLNTLESNDYGIRLSNPSGFNTLHHNNIMDKMLVDSVDYSLNTGNGEVTILNPLSLGDRVYAQYTYSVSHDMEIVNDDIDDNDTGPMGALINTPIITADISVENATGVWTTLSTPADYTLDMMTGELTINILLDAGDTIIANYTELVIMGEEILASATAGQSGLIGALTNTPVLSATIYRESLGRVLAYDDFIGDSITEFDLIDVADETTYDVLSTTITMGSTILTYGTDYTHDNDTGLITFTPALVGESGGVELTVNAILTYEENITTTIRLPNTRLTDAAVSVTITVDKVDGTGVETVPGVTFDLYRRTGLLVLHNTMRVERGVTISVDYEYYSQIGMVPITLNVLTAVSANYSFGNISAPDTEMPGVMPTWGLRAGQGDEDRLESGDRRYFYVMVPNQGRFSISEIGDYFLYSELSWMLNQSDLNIIVYGKGGTALYPDAAPYYMTEMGASEEDAHFSALTATGGPKEILVTPFNHEILTICVSSKSFNGSGDPVTAFEGRGGWIKLSDKNPQAWTNDMVGHLGVSFQSSVNLETGIFASIVGPAQGSKTTEEIYQDDLSLYDLSTLEGWLTMNAVAGFTKVFPVKNALSWDVHIVGHAECPDLDLAVFLDGLNGQPVDGEAQWQEIITLSDIEFDAYGDDYGTGMYAYSADADADEALKFISPPDGDYIVKVLGFTVNSDPGFFDLEVKSIFAGVEGYKLESVTPEDLDIEYEDENATGGSYLNRTEVSSYDVRTFNVVWAFPEGTEDGGYGGIFVFGVPEAQKLIVFSVDIALDTEAPEIVPAYTGPNAIVSTNTPTISAVLKDETRGELDQDSVEVYFDGEYITQLSTISITETVNSAGVTGLWTGDVIYKPLSPITEGGHHIEVRAEDFAGNTQISAWGFTVDTTDPVLTLDDSREEIFVNTPQFQFNGITEANSVVSVIGVSSSIRQRADNTFTIDLNLEDGPNTIAIRSVDLAGNTYEITKVITLDNAASTFKRVVALDGATTNKRVTGIYGELTEPGYLMVDGNIVNVNSDGTFRYDNVELIEGQNMVVMEFTDMAGNIAYNFMNITLDTSAPTLNLESINSVVYEQWLNLSGATDSDVASLTINGKLVNVDGSGNFQNAITLSPGTNTIVIESKDRAGNSIQEIMTVSYALETGTNWSAIGLMIMLLVVGLVLGLLFGKMMGGGEPAEEPVEDIPPEDMEEITEEDMPMDEELPEDGEMEEIPEDSEELPEDGEIEELSEEEIEDLPEGAEPIPAEEGMPEEIPEEEMPDEVEEVPEAEPEALDISEEITADELEAELPEEPEAEVEAPVEEDPRIIKLREAFESGKISEELYEKNLARFKGN